MLYRILAVLILVSLLFSLSCSREYGTYVGDKKLASLRIKETTKDEIIQLLGKPNNTMAGAGGETWRYYWKKSTRVPIGVISPILSILHDETKHERRTVSLFIDDAGILRKATVDEKPYVIRTGLLNR